MKLYERSWDGYDSDTDSMLERYEENSLMLVLLRAEPEPAA